MNKALKTIFFIPVALALMVCANAIANAEKLTPQNLIKVKAAKIRTPEDVRASENNILLTPGKIQEVREIPFRPIISKAYYNTAKSNAVKKTAASQKDSPSSYGTLAPPTLKDINFEGVNQTTAGGLLPPDTHGAIGKTHFVEVTNSHIDAYLRDGTLARSNSLASFFGYFTTTLFDPRCIYDPIWNRWVVTADAFQETSTIQYQFIAVSVTSDPEGSFYIYKIDVNTNNNDDFWDYPMLGMGQDAIIVTANIFDHLDNYVTTRMFTLAKARLYNGLNLTVPFFSGLAGTLAPPIVLDQNCKAFLVAAPENGTVITKYTLENAGFPSCATLTLSTITVPAYDLPPYASQPGTGTPVLDTLDSRFVNASTQNGNSLWQIHTINNNGRPTPKFYEFNTATNTIIQSGFISASATSHDWNASIAANTTNDVYVVWSSTNPGAGVNVQVRYSGRRNADPAGTISSGSALFTSTTYYTGFRWGDYSAVTLDPKNPLRAWIVNEKVNGPSTWGSRIGRIGF